MYLALFPMFSAQCHNFHKMEICVTYDVTHLLLLQDEICEIRKCSVHFQTLSCKAYALLTCQLVNFSIYYRPMLRSSAPRYAVTSVYSPPWGTPGLFTFHGYVLKV
jgi:hypothetical protein